MNIVISKTKRIYWPVVAFLLVQTIISNEMFWALGLLTVCCYIFIMNSRKIFLPFSEYKILFVFLAWGILLGLIALSRGTNSYVDLVRDIFYFSNPIIFMYLGASYAKEKISIFKIFNAFIITSGFLSIVQLFNILLNVSALSSAFTVQGWRNITGDGGVVIAISLAIVFAGIIPKGMRLPRILGIILVLVNVAYFILSLSRTNIMIISIMFAVLLLEKGNSKIILMRIVGVIALVFLCLFVLNFVLPSEISSSFTKKMLSSLTEVNASNSWNSPYEIQSNWRGYETYCAVNQWKDSNFIHQIFGAGFGERIYVGRYAYTLLKQVDSTGQAINSIAVLHNGYATMLIKLGVLGVIGYLLFYFAIIKKAWKAHKRTDSLDSRILLAMGLIFLIQTYFLNGLMKDYCFFPMIILIGYSAYNIQYKRL